MGARGSTLMGRYRPCEPVLAELTQAGPQEIADMKVLHSQALGSRLSLEGKHLYKLLSPLNFSKEEAKAIFEAFDTDSNNKIDALEVMSAVAASSCLLTYEEKIDAVHGFFDFNGSGDLGIDELFILFRTVVNGASKLDTRIVSPPRTELERLARWAFQKAERSLDSDLSKREFQCFVFSDPRTAHFLQYFSDACGRVVLAPDVKWTDPEGHGYFSPGGGFLKEEAVVYLRPEDFCHEKEIPRLFLSSSQIPQSSSQRRGAQRGQSTIFGGLSLMPGIIDDHKSLAAIAIVASTNFKLMRQVFVNTGQENQGRYAVALSRDGVENIVLIDDRVPCDRVTRRPLLSRTAQRAELWPLLLSKALLKFFKQRIFTLEDALIAITGGTVKKLPLNHIDSLWRNIEAEAPNLIISSSLNKKKIIVGAVVRKRRDDSSEKRHFQSGRGYAVLALLKVKDQSFIKLSKPWNDDTAPSSFMVNLPEDTTDDHHHSSALTNSFWMDLKVFVKYFEALYFIRTYEPYDWNAHRRPGKGRLNLDDSNWVSSNSQFYLQVLGNQNEVVVEVTQTNADFLGLFVAPFAFEDRTQVTKFAHVEKNATFLSSSLQKRRQLTVDLDLKKGTYVILPLFSSPDKTVSYWLTTRCEGQHKLLDETEVTHSQEPTSGSSDLPAPPVSDSYDEEEEPANETDDDEAQAFHRLHEVIGHLWLEAHRLETHQSELQARLSALLTNLPRGGVFMNDEMTTKKPLHQRRRQQKHHATAAVTSSS